MILKRGFYEQDTLTVAKTLLGCFLVRKVGKKIIRARIIETEAYIGVDDLACHASHGRTKRTETMYGEGGHAYIYLVYGMYEMLNIVTEKKDFPAAVLIRAVTIESSVIPAKAEGSGRKSKNGEIPRQARNDQWMKTDGPGKLTRALNITRTLNGWDITKGKNLWIDRPASRLRSGEKIVTTPRIGIDYAKHCREYPWRFVLMSKTL